MSKKKSKIKKIITNSSFSKIILENFKGYGKNTTVELSSGVNLIQWEKNKN